MRAHKSNFRVVCAADSAEIFLYDVIGADWYGGITAKEFSDELGKAKGVKRIDLHVNSPGGDVFDGAAMFSLLKQSEATIHAYVDGLAASIASLIIMAADTIEISANGMIMIHDPWSVTAGNAAELRKKADLLDKIRDTLVDTYHSRTGVERETLAAMMAGEKWFDAKEALDNKFADSINSDTSMAACVNMELFKKYRNVPQALLEPQPSEAAPQPTLEDRIAAARLKFRNAS